MSEASMEGAGRNGIQGKSTNNMLRSVDMCSTLNSYNFLFDTSLHSFCTWMDSRNQQLANIILGHRSVTAQVLLDTTCALLAEGHSEDKDAMHIMHHFRNRFAKEIHETITFMARGLSDGQARTNKNFLR